MSQTKHSRFEKFKWNKSQLIETNTYVKVYIETLNKHLSPEDRQTLFMISKMFTDATAEVGRDRYDIAMHHYERGERYTAQVPEEKAFLRKFLTNIYDRSKSLYYYKTGDKQEAIRLVHNTLENNRELEARGFPFLVFDRVSQYHNLSRIYFSMNEPEKAFEILSGAVCFLVAGKSSVLSDLNDNHVEEYDSDLAEMRFSLICQLLFETTMHLQREKDKELFLQDSQLFYSNIIKASSDFLVLSSREEAVKKWLTIVARFYKKQLWRFRWSAKRYLRSQPPFYNNKPHQLLEGFLLYCK